MLFHDLRFALRSLLRRPGFALAVVLTLALGLGANTAIFSVVNGVLLQPLPYEEPDRLVSLWPGSTWQRGSLPLLAESNAVYESLAGASLPLRMSLTDRAEPLRLEGVAVTGGLFETLGARALHGRTLAPGDDRPGVDRLAVLSHGLFARHFGGDSSIVGRTIRLDGVEREVVGVMPAGFAFPSPQTELWIPTTMNPGAASEYFGAGSSFEVVARLRDGASLEQADQALRAVMPQVRADYPWPMPEDFGAEATVVKLHERITGDVRPALWILLVSVGFVLLIGCVNVANLVLVRARGRGSELALRAALGAGRRRLATQVLTESLLLAVAGGLAGLALGGFAVARLRAWLPADVPRVESIVLDSRVLLFTFAVALFTGLLFGLAPALRASRPDLQTSLRASRGGGPGRRRVSDLLVAVQIAVTVVLAVGAGLLLRSFQQQTRVDPGFEAASVLTARLAPPTFRYADDAAQRVVYGELLERAGALPSVEAAAVASQWPFTGDDIYGSVFLIEGEPSPGGGEWPSAELHVVVSPGFQDALRLPLLAGQWFDGTESADGLQVAVVSRSLADSYWPNQNAIGQRIQFPGAERWLTIIGIVGDVKVDSLTAEPRGALYQPLSQAGSGPMLLVARTAGDPSALAGSLRGVVASVDGDTPVSAIQPLAALVDESLQRTRFIMLLLGAFAVLALALAAVGIYGVTAYAIGQQQRELATRLALGADPRGLLRWVVRRGVALGLVGVALGLPLALASTQVLSALLFRVSVADPLTFVLAAVLLAAVAATASYLPARRVLGTNPMLVLRAE
ncbi:MAG: ABC transporter permease [Acidobacteriota bacterium]